MSFTVLFCKSEVRTELLSYNIAIQGFAFVAKFVEARL
jgi:hypothetical protein